MHFIKSGYLVLVVILVSGVLTACKSVGQPFPFEPIEKIVVGETTSTEISSEFGPPNRVGIENGNLTWSYVDYYVSLFGTARTRDLKIKFDKQMVVVAYDYSTSDPDEGKRLSSSIQ